MAYFRHTLTVSFMLLLLIPAADISSQSPSPSPETSTAPSTPPPATTPTKASVPAAAKVTTAPTAPAAQAASPTKKQTGAKPPQKANLPKGVPPVSNEIAIILSGTAFYPSVIRLTPNKEFKLLFASTNKKPAALIIESLQVQRWVSGSGTASEPGTPTEITREVSSHRITEIVIAPRQGNYRFHDALSGAKGEIIVE